MNLYCVILVIFSTSVVNPLALRKINNIEESVQFIEFDSDSNVYIGSNARQSARIYKLNSVKDIVTKSEPGILNHIEKILITSSNTAYIFDTTSKRAGKNGSNSKAANHASLHFLGHNSSSLDKVYEFPLSKEQSHVYFMDKKENIYFNTATGVAILKPSDHDEHGFTIPKCINNLEYFSITSDSTYAIDHYGDIYLGGTTKGTKNAPKIAVIYSDDQRKSVLTAEIQNVSNSNLHLISAVSTDAGGLNALIAFSGDHARIYKPNYGSFELVFGQYLYHFSNFYSTKDRFYFFGRNLFVSGCYLYYGHYDYRKFLYNIRAVPHLFGDSCEEAKFTSDSAGNIFVAHGKEVFSLKNDEVNIKKITFSKGLEHGVTASLVDRNDHLWILAGDVYMVSKDTTVAKQMTNSTIATESGIMKIHPDTKEIFIGSENGLYVYAA